MMRNNTSPGFASDSYLEAKAHWKGIPFQKKRGKNVSRETHEGATHDRDPKPLTSILEFASQDFGWKRQMSQANLITEWRTFIGEQTADHTSVVDIRDGVVTIQCDSTAWATELRRLRAKILTRLLRDYPNVGIQELKFLSPGAPSWKHGPRSVPGRGPRDTYG